MDIRLSFRFDDLNFTSALDPGVPAMDPKFDPDCNAVVASNFSSDTGSNSGTDTAALFPDFVVDFGTDPAADFSSSSSSPDLDSHAVAGITPAGTPEIA